jgi:hypothetical protein
LTRVFINKLGEDEYPYIHKVRVYGLKTGVKKVTHHYTENGQNDQEEIIWNNYKSNENKALFIKQLELPLTMKTSYKLIIELE